MCIAFSLFFSSYPFSVWGRERGDLGWSYKVWLEENRLAKVNRQWAVLFVCFVHWCVPHHWASNFIEWMNACICEWSGLGLWVSWMKSAPFIMFERPELCSSSYRVGWFSYSSFFFRSNSTRSVSSHFLPWSAVLYYTQCLLGSQVWNTWHSVWHRGGSLLLFYFSTQTSHMRFIKLDINFIKAYLYQFV